MERLAAELACLSHAAGRALALGDGDPSEARGFVLDLAFGAAIDCCDQEFGSRPAEGWLSSASRSPTPTVVLVFVAFEICDAPFEVG